MPVAIGLCLTNNVAYSNFLVDLIEQMLFCPHSFVYFHSWLLYSSILAFCEVYLQSDDLATLNSLLCYVLIQPNIQDIEAKLLPVISHQTRVRETCKKIFVI